ncbi:YbaK/EbsC family protein [Tessaracoccus terricola]
MTELNSDLPGNLDWKPAAEGSDLLASPVVTALAALGLEAYVAPIDPELADTAAFCEAYDVELAESSNCVIVEGRRGERTTRAAVMVLATDRADVNKTIKKHLDVRKISFAHMDTATSLSAMEYGGITPVGLPAEWPVLVDQRVAESGWVVVGSGIRGSKLAVRGTDLPSLATAEVLELALPVG